MNLPQQYCGQGDATDDNFHYFDDPILATIRRNTLTTRDGDDGERRPLKRETMARETSKGVRRRIGEEAEAEE